VSTADRHVGFISTFATSGLRGSRILEGVSPSAERSRGRLSEARAVISTESAEVLEAAAEGDPGDGRPGRGVNQSIPGELEVASAQELGRRTAAVGARVSWACVRTAHPVHIQHARSVHAEQHRGRGRVHDSVRHAEYANRGHECGQAFQSDFDGPNPPQETARVPRTCFMRPTFLEESRSALAS
jgi:hypothetical protein